MEMALPPWVPLLNSLSPFSQASNDFPLLPLCTHAHTLKRREGPRNDLWELSGCQGRQSSVNQGAAGDVTMLMQCNEYTEL